MDVTIGVVVDGKIIVEGEALPEGSKVGVFVAADSEPHELSADEAAELDTAIDDVLLAELRSGRPCSLPFHRFAPFHPA